MKVFRLLLFPFSLLYGLIVAIRNILYDLGILKSYVPPVKTICVGNLSVGGTGKTPHIEYLVNLLKKKVQVATLSRGYGRKTKGFILAQHNTTATTIGDEPMQFKKQFMDLPVAVCENRALGIQKIVAIYPGMKAILLDDAFQHRSVNPGLSIILTDYHQPYYKDFMLPTGNLREFSYGKKRANIIVVTKCPNNLTISEQQKIIEQLKPTENQLVFFSYITYSDLLPINPANEKLVINDLIKNKFDILLFTGIANSKHLQQFLHSISTQLRVIEFADHHTYSAADIGKIKSSYEQMQKSKTIIITTEKDFMRLQEPSIQQLDLNLPIYYIPIQVKIYQHESFDKAVLSYVFS